MTIVAMMEELKRFCVDAAKDIKLPTSVQKGDTTQEIRSPEVYKNRLPDSSAAKKVAPYILIQFVSSRDEQQTGKTRSSTALVRFIFCVYDKNEEEGATMLLNVMERVRIALLKKVAIAKQFKLDEEAGLESMIYIEDTAPYYAGEMVGSFILPPIEREVKCDGQEKIRKTYY